MHLTALVGSLLRQITIYAKYVYAAPAITAYALP